MARKSKIAPVREYLIIAVAAASKEQADAARTERYRDAETYKCFKDVLARALELCGDVNTEGKDERTNTPQ